MGLFILTQAKGQILCVSECVSAFNRRVTQSFAQSHTEFFLRNSD